MTAYSSGKVFHHRDKIDQLKAGEQTVPLQVHLIISDLCNQDCSFCAYRMSGYTTNELFKVVHPESGEIILSSDSHDLRPTLSDLVLSCPPALGKSLGLRACGYLPCRFFLTVTYTASDAECRSPRVWCS